MVEEEKSDDEVAEVAKPQFSKGQEWWIVIGGAVAMCFYIGVETNCFRFLAAYAVDVLPTDKFSLAERTRKGADLSAGLGFAFAAGRAIGMVEAVKMRSYLVLACHVGLMACANLIFMCCPKTEMYLWIGTILIGLGLSSMNATLYTYCEERIRMVSEKIKCIHIGIGPNVITFKKKLHNKH